MRKKKRNENEIQRNKLNDVQKNPEHLVELLTNDKIMCSQNSINKMLKMPQE